jgi:hypothetical protein
MKSRMLHRRLAAIEANFEVAESMRRERIAEALTKLTDDELDRLHQLSVTDSDVSSYLDNVCSKGLIQTVDEIAALYRSAIGGSKNAS